MTNDYSNPIAGPDGSWLHNQLNENANYNEDGTLTDKAIEDLLTFRDEKQASAFPVEFNGLFAASVELPDEGESYFSLGVSGKGSAEAFRRRDSDDPASGSILFDIEEIPNIIKGLEQLQAVYAQIQARKRLAADVMRPMVLRALEIFNKAEAQGLDLVEAGRQAAIEIGAMYEPSEVFPTRRALWYPNRVDCSMLPRYIGEPGGYRYSRHEIELGIPLPQPNRWKSEEYRKFVNAFEAAYRDTFLNGTDQEKE